MQVNATNRIEIGGLVWELWHFLDKWPKLEWENQASGGDWHPSLDGILTTSCGSRGRIRGDYQSLVIFASIGGSFKNMEQDLTAAQLKFSQMIRGGYFLLFTPY